MEKSVLHLNSNILNDSGVRESIKIGKSVHVHGELAVMGGNGQIEIGNHSFVGPNTRIWSWKRISVGDDVLISHNCNIFDSTTHPYSAEARARQYRHILKYGNPRDLDLGQSAVIIEDHAWIACNSTILKGVKIGEGAIVGAGSVVTKDVPAWSVVAGNPARVIRILGEDER